MSRTGKSNALAIATSGLGQAEAAAAISTISRLIPRVREKTLARYIAAGFTGSNLQQVEALIAEHKTTLPAIYKWKQRSGLSLRRIEICLGIREDYAIEDQQMTVAAISRYLSWLGFSENDPLESRGVPDSVMEVFSTFMEMAERLGGDYPLQRIWYRIRDQFGSNVQAAYDMAVSEQRVFLDIVRGKISRDRAVLILRGAEVTAIDEEEDLEFENEGLTGGDDSARRLIARLVEDAGGY